MIHARGLVLAAVLTVCPAAGAQTLSRVEISRREWSVHFEVMLRTFAPPPEARRDGATTDVIALTGFEFLFPVIPATSMSVPRSAEIDARVQVEGRRLKGERAVLEGYQGPSAVAVWSAVNQRLVSPNLRFITERSVTSYETVFDEAAANRIGWPSAPWSPELALCLEGQLFVEPEDARVRALVDEWTRGAPKSAPPCVLAKALAAACINHFNVTETEFFFERQSGNRIAGTRGFEWISGFNVKGAAWAAAERRGSAYDLVCLYTAACRAAGLPARMVIGLDVRRSERQNGRPVLRAWTEFFLPHEGLAAGAAVGVGDGEWIPVDIARQKESSSRAPALDQRWWYFGQNDEFDDVAPLAFHWLPPEDVTGTAAPGLWGWRPRPGNPLVSAVITMWGTELPRRGR